MVRPRALPISVLILITLLVQLGTPGIAWADGESPTSETPPTSEGSSDGAMTVAEILSEAPAGTDVVVVDPAGSPEPLATELAAEAVAQSDPIWCPGSVPATDRSCTPAQATVTALLNYLDLNPSYAGNGTLYFTTDYGFDDARLSGGDPRLADLAALTIDGQGHTITVPLEVTGWAYDVSIENLRLDLSAYVGTAAALRAETSGAIGVTGIAVTGSGGDGAYLDNTAGTQSVDVDTSSFSGNGWTGLDVRSDGDIALNNVSAGGQAQEDGAYLDASTGPGSITITDSDFSGNMLAGLTARTSSGDVDLTNVTAEFNSPVAPTSPTALGLSAPSLVAASEAYGMGLTATAGGAITITGGRARQNAGKGLWIEGTGPVNLDGFTASDNMTHGAYIHNLAACEAAPITVTVTNGAYENNGGFGILAVLGPGGAFNLAGTPVFGGNLLGDYEVNLDPCPACEKDGGEGKPYNTINVPEIGVPPIPLDCELYAGTVFVLPNGDRATLVCPVGGEATASPAPADGLPGPLPAGRTYVSGASVAMTKDGQPVLTITEGGYLKIAFAIPEDLRGKSLAILYWDPIANAGAGGWVELPPYAARPDGSPLVHRLHPSASPDDGMYILGGVRVFGDTATVKVNFAGTFVLVAR